VATPKGKNRKPASASPSVPQPAASRPDRTRTLVLAAVIACATLPYVNILYNGFVYDDETQVVHNPYIRSFRYLKEIFTTHVWSFMASAATNYYRPIMTLGYLFCYKLFGLRAYGFHLASLLLHVLVVCLVFILAERLTGHRVCAVVAGALFALHPVHTESVAWIAAVTDLELTFFYLLTFWFYLALGRPGDRRSKLMFAAMTVAFILALLSKEQAVTLAALATVYEHFYRDDRSETTPWQKLGRYGPLWLASAVYVFYRIHFLGALAPRDKSAHLTPLQTGLSAIALVGQYVGKLLWPAQLCAFHAFHPSKSLFEPRVLAGLLVLFALAALFLFCWRSRERNVRFASFGIIWFFATLAPVLNPHWLGPNAFAERYLYLPSVSVSWLAGLGVSKLWSLGAAHPRQRGALTLAGIVIAGLFAAIIVVRNRDWKNDLVFYTQTIAVEPEAYPIIINLGTVYWDQGAYDKAESLWRGVLAKYPNDAEALTNMGLVAGRKQQYLQASDYFQRAIKIRPTDAQPHLDLAKAYRLMGQMGPAESELRTARKLAPFDYQVSTEFGRLLLQEGRLSEAADQLRDSLRDEPTAVAYDFLGEINLRWGNLPEAERNFQAALSLDPSDSNAHFGIGYVSRALGRKAEALSQYQSGLMKDPTNAQALAAVQELRQGR
jgi:Flp pilus assembly protein TadD